jgi:NAD(P)-dependent dehydrogenase (short-subunit alcohol dehydrogenase family)
MNTSMRLSGKTVLITGAGQGIGRSTAQIFAKEGAKLFIIGRTLDKLNAVAEEIKNANAGSQVIAMKADVTDQMQVNEAVKATVEAFGGVDVLINNAGVTLTRPFTETSLEDIDFLIDVNFKGIVLTSQAVIPHMAKSGGGSIVHDASNAGIVGRPWQSVYGASKAAVISITKSMALSLASQKIRVNCVCPGSIDTPMLRNALSKSGNFEESWQRTEMVTPLGCIGDPEDIAYATLFLASDESKFITGVSLPVDGGRTVGIAETFHVGMDTNK